MKKILMVTYDFPPIGGGGIQRNVKFLKYLSRLGWETSVLTVKERDFYVYDYTMLEEIKNTKVFKAFSADPVSLSSAIKKRLSKTNDEKTVKNGINESAWYVDIYRVVRDWAMLPDGYGGWIPFAYRKGKQIIKDNKPDVLYATFPYPSNAFVTYYLSKKFKIPFVIDFRDPWLDDMYVKFPSFLHKNFHKHFEKKITNAAVKVIVYGEPLKHTLLAKYPKLNGKIEVITNGFDPEDFSNLSPLSKNGKIRIVYSGAVYVDRRETYKEFLQALKLLSEEDLRKLEVIFVGDKLQWATDLVDEFKLDKTVSFAGYKNHSDALNYLSSADVALMFLKKGDRYALTGKIFEYLGLGLPVMACVEPDGACAELLRSIDHGQGVADPSSAEKMKEVLEKIISEGLPKLEPEKAKIYSRKYHSERLSEILNQI